MTDPAWLTSTHVAVVAGKGGVGSSTVAAAYALAAARDGADVLFVAVDGRPGMGTLLGGRPLDDTDRILQRVTGAGQVRGRTIPVDQAFGDYLDLRGVGGLLRRAALAASLPMIAAATPGLQHLLVLGKIKELERERAADLIVVDAPPAGHAAPFLRSATGLSDVVQSGPIREQAEEVNAMLTDPARCRAMIVVLPEVTPVTEGLELAAEVGGRAGHRSAAARGQLVLARSCRARQVARRRGAVAVGEAVGRVKRTLDSSTAFGRARLDQQRSQIARLRSRSMPT